MVLMTQQQAFTKIVTHLRAQNAQSRAGDGVCAYRGKNGRSCAAGCLISDDEYDPYMEQQPVSELFDTFPYQTRRVILAMQRIHDDTLPEVWESQFEVAARLYKLELPAP